MDLSNLINNMDRLNYFNKCLFSKRELAIFNEISSPVITNHASFHKLKNYNSVDNKNKSENNEDISQVKINENSKLNSNINENRQINNQIDENQYEDKLNLFFDKINFKNEEDDESNIKEIEGFVTESINSKKGFNMFLDKLNNLPLTNKINSILKNTIDAKLKILNKTDFIDHY